MIEKGNMKRMEASKKVYSPSPPTLLSQSESSDQAMKEILSEVQRHYSTSSCAQGCAHEGHSGHIHTQKSEE